MKNGDISGAGWSARPGNSAARRGKTDRCAKKKCLWVDRSVQCGRASRPEARIMTFHDISATVIPTDRSERRVPGSNRERGGGIRRRDSLRAPNKSRGAQVGMTGQGEEGGAMAKQNRTSIGIRIAPRIEADRRVGPTCRETVKNIGSAIATALSSVLPSRDFARLSERAFAHQPRAGGIGIGQLPLEDIDGIGAERGRPVSHGARRA